jgi:hypothetical protein
MLSVISFSKKEGSGVGKSNQLSWSYCRSTAGCIRDRGGDRGRGGVTYVFLCCWFCGSLNLRELLLFSVFQNLRSMENLGERRKRRDDGGSRRRRPGAVRRRPDRRWSFYHVGGVY